ADAALALVGRRSQVVEAEAELLVLGADAPVGDRLRAGGEKGDKLVARADRGLGEGGIWAGHVAHSTLDGKATGDCPARECATISPDQCPAGVTAGLQRRRQQSN